MRLLLDYCCSGSQRSSRNDVADLHLDDVAAAQLAVDRKVEQSAVAQTSMLVEEEADSPHIARFQRSLRANRVARVPRTASVGAAPDMWVIGVKRRSSATKNARENRR